MKHVSKAVLLALVTFAAPASAQTTEADTTAADSTQAAPDSTASPRLGALLRRVAADASEARVQEPPPPAAPTLYVFGSGLRVTLPPGWVGASSVQEPDPGYGLYTFQNDAPGHPLQGVALKLERVTGVNDLLRERWLRGQTPHGYHGTRPVGPGTAPVPGFAAEVEGPGVRGVSVFTQRPNGFWALQVVAPMALWAERRGEVTALLSGVHLP